MAIKEPILLQQEARDAIVNTINYYLQQGVPIYEMVKIFELLKIDIDNLYNKECEAAQQRYNEALAAEKLAQQEAFNVQETE